MTDSAMESASPPGSLGEREYLSQRVQKQIDWYDKKSGWSQWWFKRLRIVEIVAAAMIPFLTAVPDITNGPRMKYIIGALGVVITIAAGVLALFQFQERWIEYRATSEALTKEKFLFLTKTEPYAGAEGFAAFVQRVENLLSKENTGWAQSLIKPKQGEQTTA